MNEQQIFDLTNGLFMQGDLKVQAGDLAAAKNAYQRAKGLASKISMGNNAGYAIACDKLGDLARFSDDFPNAHEEYNQALPIFRKLATVHAEHRRDVSLCLSKIGELALAKDDIPAAQIALNEHYEIAELIANSDPSNCEHQRDLAGAHGRLQQLAMATGTPEEALGHAESAHAIVVKLAAIDPSNAGLVQDLAGSQCMFASLLMQTGNLKRAISMLKDGIRILRDLDQLGKLDAKGKRLKAQLDQFGLML